MFHTSQRTIGIFNATLPYVKHCGELADAWSLQTIQVAPVNGRLKNWLDAKVDF